MVISCFRGGRGNSLTIDDDRPEAPRPAKKSSSRFLKRQASGGSTSSTASSCSNASISKLPPCKRASDPKIEAMMMPLPTEARPSRCLRLSQPRLYGSIVSDMKATRGCRDWKSFNVFYDDDVDMTMTAEDYAKKRALDYQKKLRQLWSFDSGPSTPTSIEVDMIG